MKLRNLLITLGLTLTVGAGVAVVTGIKQNEEPKAAEAASSGTRRIFLVDQIGANASNARLYLSTTQTSLTSKLLFQSLGTVNNKPVYYADAPTGTAYHYVVRTSNTDAVWNYTETSFTLSNTVNEIFLYQWNGNYMKNSTANAYPVVNVSGTDKAMAWNPTSETWTYSFSVSSATQFYVRANMNDLDKYMGYVSDKSAAVDSCTQGDYLVSQDNHNVYKLTTPSNNRKYTITVGASNIFTYGDPTYDWGSSSSITHVNQYIVTFYPNGGTGSQTSETVAAGSYTIPTPAAKGIGAGAARVMLSWNTQSDGEGTTYKIDGTSKVTISANLQLYLIQDFKQYEYSVDGGTSWVQMPRTTTGEGCAATYASDASNYLPAGQIIQIRGYYSTGTHSSQSINTWTGNTYAYGGDHYISIGTYNKIVLNVTTGGNFNIDVWGGSARGIAINRDDFITKYECELNETTHNFTGTITVLPGDKIEAFYNYATVYEITMTNYSSYGIEEDGTVTVPAVYQLTLTYASADNYPTVNVDSMVAIDSATLIAQTFNSDMTPLCTTIEGGGSASTLTTQWSVESGYYSKLSSATQNILNGTTSSSDGDVLAMQAKYDRIVGKYKNSGIGITDYMNRNPAAIQSSGLLGLSIFSNGQNQSLVIVIVITSLGILSVGAYFFFRKSKKSEE